MMTINVKAGNEELGSLFQGLKFARGERYLEVPFTIADSLSPGKYTMTLEATGALDSKPDHTVVTAVDVTVTVKE